MSLGRTWCYVTWQRALESIVDSTTITKRFWVMLAGMPSGPFTLQQIHDMLNRGEIRWQQTLACPVGQGSWATLIATPGIGPTTIASTTATAMSLQPASLPSKDLKESGCSFQPSSSHDPPTHSSTGAIEHPSTTNAPSRTPELPASVPDRFLAYAMVASIACWLLNEVFGRALLLVAGQIWVVVGIRAILVGRMPEFSTRSKVKPLASRLIGAVLTILGVAAAATVINELTQNK